ncbi:MAG: ornithine carbamoyltransferase, partial [Deltaproteobacteria bacterium]|nr:ornithine carbamoyltransferase [Deltaproteobacteria bacterium]
MTKKDFLTIPDFSRDEIAEILDRAFQLKEASRAWGKDGLLEGKILALLFEKPSTRTRVSFEVAMYQLGGQTIFLNANDTQLSRSESLADTA